MLCAELPGLVPGAVIADKYRVDRLLGRGGMGIVIAARHLELNQELAIKVLLPSAAANAQSTARFLREGRSAARITSSHVARVHDTGRLSSGEPYLVMEFLRGSDLSAILGRSGTIPVERAVAWILDAAEALAEAHSLGIIHRDIKPSNIFLSETASGPHVKVLDFGIAKEGGADTNLTATEHSMGTPRYMAPEQMRSAKHTDARADIWSLGVVLYELTTGKSPFKGDSVTEIIIEVLETNPIPPSVENEAIPPALDAVIRKCLEKHPDDRFQSVPELMAALHSARAQPATSMLQPHAAQLAPTVASASFPNTRTPSFASGVASTPSFTPGPQTPFPQLGATPHPGADPRGYTPVPAPGADLLGHAPVPAAAPAVAPSTDGTMHPWNVQGDARAAPRKRSSAEYLAAVLLLVVIGGGIGGYVWIRSHSSDATSAASPTSRPSTPPASATSKPDSLSANGTASPTATPSAEAPPTSVASSAAAVSTTSPTASASPAVTAPTASQPQAFVPVVPRPQAQPPIQPPPPQPALPSANCNPPFTIDAMGMKHAKPECL